MLAILSNCCAKFGIFCKTTKLTKIGVCVYNCCITLIYKQLYCFTFFCQKVVLQNTI